MRSDQKVLYSIYSLTKHKPTEVCWTTDWIQTKGHSVLGAGENGSRLRGVFGIPHAAAKINNQLFSDSWGKKQDANYGGRGEILCSVQSRGGRTIDKVMLWNLSRHYRNCSCCFAKPNFSCPINISVVTQGLLKATGELDHFVSQIKVCVTV